MKSIDDFILEHGAEAGAYNLDPGKQSDREKLSSRCRERSLYLLQDTDRSEAKLRSKLRASGKYPEEIISETIGFLKTYGYLDDARLAERFVESQAGQRSRREIERKLMERGVGRETIREALNACPEDAELSAARKFLGKKCRDLAACDEAEKRKLYAALLRKGFSPDTVRQAMRIDEEYA